MQMNKDCLNIQLKGDLHMEVLIGGSVATFAIYAASKWNKSDKEKIQHTFKNIGYKVGDHEPKLFKTHREETYTRYVYHVPYGLVDDPKLDVLEKVLNKPVDVSFVNQKLNIKVYKERLPVRLNYDWKESDGWTVPIGKTYSGMIYHDFDKIPHMTISGMTRQGKTVLLKLILAHLINNHPNDVEFYIIDLKGGLEFGQYERLKQVKAVASNVEEAHHLLESLQKQIKKDMSEFKEKGYTNILETQNNRRKFVIVDEGAELTPDRHHSKEEKAMFSYCQYVLSEICRVAGALGYRNIFCTQYPTADTLPRQIKQNSDAKISFRLPTEVASRVAIDEQGAERLEVVGRAIYRTADKHVLQVPYVSDKDIKDHLKEWEEDVSSNSKENKTVGTDTLIFE